MTIATAMNAESRNGSVSAAGFGHDASESSESSVTAGGYGHDASESGESGLLADDTAVMSCPLVATERLFVPHPKRLLWTYDVNEHGARELRINYGVKEITFDDERFFAFGEQLATEHAFTGERATTWGAGYPWAELQPLLESLLDEQILERGERPHEDARGTGLVPSRLPPAECPMPRAWSLAECESITRDLTGRAVEVGYLEAIVPAFRIPHPALDADGRQVGEANVFPRRLRIERETEWRVCQYPGSRYRDDTPMNVTALKAMIKHWKPMMAAIVMVRDELQERLGLAPGGWSIGQLHHLACVVCSLPSFQLLQGGGASPQVPLHPVLSSLFRVTDGVRMAMYEMMFDVKRTRTPDEPMTASAVYAHVERNGTLMGSKTGVCAGPKHMIEEYLAAVVDGADLERYRYVRQPPEVQALLDQLPAVVDYALLGLQSWSLVLAIWTAQSRLYEALIAIFDTAAPNPALTALRARLHADWARIAQSQMSLEHDRLVHIMPLAYAYETSWDALREPVGHAVYADELAASPADARDRAVAGQLRAVLATRFAGTELVTGTAKALDLVVSLLVDYLREEQTILAAVVARQDSINALLERPGPQRAVTVRDLRIVYMMQGDGTPYPHLLDSLDDVLGIDIQCTATTLAVIDRRAT